MAGSRAIGAVALTALGRVDNLPVVEAFDEAALWIAVTVWGVVFIYLLRQIQLGFLGSRRYLMLASQVASRTWNFAES